MPEFCEKYPNAMIFVTRSCVSKTVRVDIIDSLDGYEFHMEVSDNHDLDEIFSLADRKFSKKGGRK